MTTASLGEALRAALVVARCHRRRWKHASDFGWLRFDRLRRREASRCALWLRQQAINPT